MGLGLGLGLGGGAQAALALVKEQPYCDDEGGGERGLDAAPEGDDEHEDVVVHGVQRADERGVADEARLVRFRWGGCWARARVRAKARPWVRLKGEGEGSGQGQRSSLGEGEGEGEVEG